jgi:predicted nucleotidyltransferase component of viral defense system
MSRSGATTESLTCWPSPKEFADEVIFFGGTALSRTHLLHARRSEDIDL